MSTRIEKRLKERIVENVREGGLLYFIHPGVVPTFVPIIKFYFLFKHTEVYIIAFYSTVVSFNTLFILYLFTLFYIVNGTLCF